MGEAHDHIAPVFFGQLAGPTGHGLADPPEAHDPERMMFGFPRLAELMNGCSGGPELIQLLLGELDGFTGPDWEQEDDITLVALQRAVVPAVAEPSKAPALVS